MDAWFVRGNHGELRPMGSKRGDYPDENMERIIPWWISERLRDNMNVKIHSDCGKMHLIPVQGYNILLTHGDEFRSIDEVCKQTMLIYGEKVDVLVCGHYHREQNYVSGFNDSGTTYILRAPTIAGTSEYAQKNCFGGAAAAEAFVMEKGYGRRCHYPINLQI